MSGYNSELGNKPFSEKKGVFEKSNFALSHEIALSPTWNEEHIKNRANYLAELALQIWSLSAEYNAASDKIEIDYSTTYNIMDNIKVTNEQPRSYIIDDEEKTVYTWKALFLGILKYLYEFDPVEFSKILKNETFMNRHLVEPSESDYQFRSKSTDEVCPGYYAETGHSAQDLISFTQIAAEIYGLQDEIFFTLRRKDISFDSETKSLTETQLLQLRFWQTFADYAKDNHYFTQEFSFQKPSAQHWYTFTVGSSEYHLNLTVNSKEKRVGVDIYISNNKDLFRKLKYQQQHMEAFIGMRLECVEASKACRVKTFFSGDIRDSSSWECLFNWFIETTLKFKELIGRFA